MLLFSVITEIPNDFARKNSINCWIKQHSKLRVLRTSAVSSPVSTYQRRAVPTADIQSHNGAAVVTLHPTAGWGSVTWRQLPMPGNAAHLRITPGRSQANCRRKQTLHTRTDRSIPVHRLGCPSGGRGRRHKIDSRPKCAAIHCVMNVDDHPSDEPNGRA